MKIKIKTDSELTPMIELVDKDVKMVIITLFDVVKNQRINVLSRGMENIKQKNF